VKRLCADDSAATSVKVGYRQASYKEKAPFAEAQMGLFCFSGPISSCASKRVPVELAGVSA
jgi:hypothetical protein